MSRNTFGVGTVPPPPLPPMPGYPQQPPRPPANNRRGRWLALVAAAVLGAAAASAAAAVITVQARNTTNPTPNTVAPNITVTVPAPSPTAPSPLPTAQADRQTCQVGFIGTQTPTKSAAEALAVLPPAVKVLDPAVQANLEWSTAVRNAGRFYKQASDALRSQIAPGTTPVLAQAAHAAVDAFQLVGDAYTTFDPIAGNAYEIALSASDQMVALCTRLAP